MEFQYQAQATQPWPTSTLLGRLSFGYMTPFVNKGYKTPVEHANLFVSSERFVIANVSNLQTLRQPWGQSTS